MSLQIKDNERKQLDLEEIKAVHVELIDKLEGKVKKQHEELEERLESISKMIQKNE